MREKEQLVKLCEREGTTSEREGKTSERESGAPGSQHYRGQEEVQQLRQQVSDSDIIVQWSLSSPSAVSHEHC